jgi:hypothetical protein
MAFGRHVSIPIIIIYSESKTSRAIDWYMYGSDRGRREVGGPSRGSRPKLTHDVHQAFYALLPCQLSFPRVLFIPCEFSSSI